MRVEKRVYRMVTDKPLKTLIQFDDVIRSGEGLYIPSEEERKKEEQKNLRAKNLGKVGGNLSLQGK